MDTNSTDKKTIKFLITYEQSYIIISLFFSVLIFIFSMKILEFYQYGDQFVYREYWAEAQTLNFKDTYALLKTYIDTKEPAYAILTYLFSDILNKDIVMSTLNAILAYYLVKWMLLKNVFIILIPIILLNFYLVVLFFSAERLKLALLFLLIAEQAKVFRYGFYLLALVSHLTVIILFAARYAHYFFEALFNLFRGFIIRSHIFYLIFLLILLAGFFIVFQDHIVHKFHHYHNKSTFSIIGILKISLFIAAASFYAPIKSEPIYAGIPILILASLLGPERLVIFSYFLFMYYGLQYRNGLNFGVIVISYYMGFKSFFFIQSIVNYGDGFHTLLAR